MYELIQKQIATDFFQHNFANDGQRFVAWYLRNILFRDMNETRDDITDGADDKQIDALIVDDDKSLVRIIQGKFVQGGTVDAEPLREVLSSWLQIKDLARLQNVANPKLARKLRELADAFEEDYEVSFELVTTGTLTEAAQHDLLAFQEELAKLSENEAFDATIHVIDADELRRRYDYAIEADNPSINYKLPLAGVKHMYHEIAGTPVLIAALPLKECVKLPGIKDGTLFQKNVRQSLGSSNAVNKGIRSSILGDKRSDFFFFHNGVTALCNKLTLENDTLSLWGLSIVNGCQSLNTILSCSETVKKVDDAFILFRFYEIPQRDRADKISIYTNSQSAVKARDLRSNDKRVLSIKKAYELRYPTGYFITKRGETAPADKDKKLVVDLSSFAKNLVAWQTLRPNLSYGETKIFDKYFETLFKNKDYPPENVSALNTWMNEILAAWVPENPLSLNETLLAMKAYAPYHHLYAVAIIFAISSNQSDRVPSAHRALASAQQFGMVDQIVRIAGTCLNMALEAAANEPQAGNRVFSPQNWVKSKACLAGINGAVRNYLNMLKGFPGGAEIKKQLDEATVLPVDAFEYRLSAD
ncbi:AIPR family protein [Burkholderia sp. Tr-20390]|uniref:AIPR family protein n=1 Tax=Burkholderia sp. Tr-20390 TaxID=2703904 RepID=UPI00197D3BCE|nr:AIPR family protein [Burkholderia sp. Tr-20390]MBN3735157.1 AIPR family protein [Burkholderia sp. Tr-20390]